MIILPAETAWAPFMKFKNYVKAIFIKSNTLMHEHGGAHDKNKNKKTRNKLRNNQRWSNRLSASQYTWCFAGFAVINSAGVETRFKIKWDVKKLLSNSLRPPLWKYDRRRRKGKLTQPEGVSRSRPKLCRRAHKAAAALSALHPEATLESGPGWRTAQSAANMPATGST